MNEINVISGYADLKRIKKKQRLFWKLIINLLRYKCKVLFEK